MLRLCHELPRYSLDMDFWFVKDTDFAGFFDRLSAMLEKDYKVTDSWNKHYSILVELQRAKGSPRLKIEIRKKSSCTWRFRGKDCLFPAFSHAGTGSWIHP